MAVAIIGGSFQIPPSCHGGYSPSQFVPSLSHDALRPPNPPCNLKGQGESGSPLKGAFDCPPRPRPPPPWGACRPPCPLPPLLRCVRLVPSGAFGAWRCAPLGLCFALLPLFPLGYSLLVPLMGARARPLRRVGTTQPPPLRQARPAPPRLCKATWGSSSLLGSVKVRIPRHHRQGRAHSRSCPYRTGATDGPIFICKVARVLCARWAHGGAVPPLGSEPSLGSVGGCGCSPLLPPTPFGRGER